MATVRPARVADAPAMGQLGFDETVLWVLPANARARRFYKDRRRSTSEEISSATPVGTE